MRTPLSFPIVLLLLGSGLVVGEDRPGESEPEPELKPSSPKWERDIARFETADRETPPQPGGVMFLGSSSMRLWDLEQFFPTLRAVNRGFGGSEVVDAVIYADRIVKPHAPRTIVLYAGDNDIAHNVSPEQVHARFVRFTEWVAKNLPGTRVIFVAIKPSLKRWNLADRMKTANEKIAATCANDDDLIYLDIWTPMLGDDGRPREELFVSDGLHLSPKGYALWTKLLRPHLENSPEQPAS